MADDDDDIEKSVEFLSQGEDGFDEDEAREAAERMKEREELPLEDALQKFAGNYFVRLEDAPQSDRKYLYLQAEAEQFLNDFDARSIARTHGYNTEVNRRRSNDQYHVITLVPN